MRIPKGLLRLASSACGIPQTHQFAHPSTPYPHCLSSATVASHPPRPHLRAAPADHPDQQGASEPALRAPSRAGLCRPAGDLAMPTLALLGCAAAPATASSLQPLLRTHPRPPRPARLLLPPCRALASSPRCPLTPPTTTPPSWTLVSAAQGLGLQDLAAAARPFALPLLCAAAVSIGRGQPLPRWTWECCGAPRGNRSRLRLGICCLGGSWTGCSPPPPLPPYTNTRPHPAPPRCTCAVNKPKLREKYGILDEWVLPYKASRGAGNGGMLRAAVPVCLARPCSSLPASAAPHNAPHAAPAKRATPHPVACRRPLQVIPIIDIPGFGTAAAEKVCTDMKIQSQVGLLPRLPHPWGSGSGPRAAALDALILAAAAAAMAHGGCGPAHAPAPAQAALPALAPPLPAPPQNDTKKLAEAKQLVYLKGFTDGVLIVGEHAGKKVGDGAGWVPRAPADGARPPVSQHHLALGASVRWVAAWLCSCHPAAQAGKAQRRALRQADCCAGLPYRLTRGPFAPCTRPPPGPPSHPKTYPCPAPCPR